VYVDDLNIFGSTQDIDEARDHLKLEFEMKDLGKKNCLGLQIENLQSGMLVHPENIEKIQYGQTIPNNTPMVVRSWDLEKDAFRPREEEKRYWVLNILILFSLER
jgi:hypothetical protein